jgi:hypothetical protein
MLKLYFSFIGESRIVLYKNSFLTYSKNSRIAANKGFYFNKSWNATDPFPSCLFVGENAEFLINGNFLMYSGSSISIEKDNCLILRSGLPIIT